MLSQLLASVVATTLLTGGLAATSTTPQVAETTVPLSTTVANLYSTTEDAAYLLYNKLESLMIQAEKEQLAKSSLHKATGRTAVKPASTSRSKVAPRVSNPTARNASTAATARKAAQARAEAEKREVSRKAALRARVIAEANARAKKAAAAAKAKAVAKAKAQAAAKAKARAAAQAKVRAAQVAKQKAAEAATQRAAQQEAARYAALVRQQQAAQRVAVKTAPALPATTDLRSRIVATAASKAGLPYRYGGTSPVSGFDCSGFTQWVFAQNGLGLPRTARAQQASVQRIPASQARPGDLIFMGSPAYHVGIVANPGAKQYWHSPRTGRTVSLDSWNWNTASFGRVLP